MNADEMLRLLGVVAALWPTFEVNDATPEAWLMVLGDVELDRAHAALVELNIEGGQWAPTPGLVRRKALAAAAGIPDPDEALAEAFAAARAVGRFGVPQWSHPAVGQAVAAIGGWREFCLSENPEAMRAHFLSAYRTVAAREERTAVLPPAVLTVLAPTMKPLPRGA